MEGDPCKIKKWRCNEDEPLWRMYMNSYLENERQLEKNDKFDRRKAAELPRLPALETNEIIQASQTCFPLNTFNIDAQIKLPDRLNNIEKIRIWSNMKSDPLDLSQDKIPFFNEKLERKIWPCNDRNFYEEQRQLEILKKREQKCLLSCQSDPVIELDLINNFADNKELGHARIPVTCLKKEKYYLVDRAAGDKPGLVDGDYIYLELSSDTQEKRVYSEVCLRGLKGMHLMELNRERENTWKFCFYQSLVALLAKTQLRYKYATSINIDYIYDHAWMLFVHMGNMNIKRNLQLDDIVVYNYKYSIELELIDELIDIEKITDASWNYLEKNFNKIKEHKRPELMKISETIGWEKINLHEKLDIHLDTKEIEYWLETIPLDIKNFILRTNKFSLACWNDGNFWYLYNPYRCNKFGFWDDSGYACLMKFCSRSSLNRHIIIILIRAYIYDPARSLKLLQSPKNLIKKDKLKIQIFKIIYNCVKIHDLRVLKRQPAKPPMKKITKNNEEEVISNADNVEKLNWLIKYKITWKKNSDLKKNGIIDKLKWHNYDIVEIGKIYSLWSEIHPTEEIFHMKNRGKQIYACYVVCAGMTKIISPEYWSTKTLNTIVMCGDRYYTLSRLENNDTITNKNNILLKFYKIGNILFEVDFVSSIKGKLYTDNNSLWKLMDDIFKKYTFVVLTCENYCLGIFKSCGAYYMFDVKSIGPPLFDYGNGLAYLIRTTCFIKLLHVLLLTIGSNECSDFSLNPIDILKTVEITTNQNENIKLCNNM